MSDPMPVATAPRPHPEHLSHLKIPVSACATTYLTCQRGRFEPGQSGRFPVIGGYSAGPARHCGTPEISREMRIRSAYGGPERFPRRMSSRHWGRVCPVCWTDVDLLFNARRVDRI